jgi:nicotinate-nucleotide adenylyltransferase
LKIGLFFGSFNPIHVGHLIIASTIVETTDLSEIWFVVSPRNPLKSSKSLLHEFDRYDMVQRAIADDFRFRVSDVEFNMPRPSYTSDTLAFLSDKHRDKQFELIIGEDNLVSFKKWKNYEAILENYGLIVYPRPGMAKSEVKPQKNIRIVEAPLLDIPATFIRKLVREEKSIKYLVPQEVEQLILAKKYYT